MQADVTYTAVKQKKNDANFNARQVRIATTKTSEDVEKNVELEGSGRQGLPLSRGILPVQSFHNCFIRQVCCRNWAWSWPLDVDDLEPHVPIYLHHETAINGHCFHCPITNTAFEGCVVGLMTCWLFKRCVPQRCQMRSNWGYPPPWRKRSCPLVRCVFCPYLYRMIYIYTYNIYMYI